MLAVHDFVAAREKRGTWMATEGAARISTAPGHGEFRSPLEKELNSPAHCSRGTATSETANVATSNRATPGVISVVPSSVAAWFSRVVDMGVDE